MGNTPKTLSPNGATGRLPISTKPLHYLNIANPRPLLSGNQKPMASTRTRLLVHLVFSTKNREPQISEELQDSLYSYLGGLVRSVDCSMLAVGGMPDHVHLLVRLHPNTGVAPLVNKIKANSSRWVNEGRRSEPRFAWQRGYGAFSVSESQVGVVKQYIAHQVEHHRKRSFREELVELLQKHGVEFDERYLLG
jgi:putative transposase